MVKDNCWKWQANIEHQKNAGEKLLAVHLKLSYVDCKKEKVNSNSLVPIPFISETVEAIDLLFRYQSQVTIADTNKHLFARGL